MKHEWRKVEKEVYLPSVLPQTISIPNYNFLTISGTGDPNAEDFQHRVEILFAMAYGIKMAPRKGILIDGYFDYTVYPLEGLWDYTQEAKDKGWMGKRHFSYTLMIRQPSFVTETLVQEIKKTKMDATKDLLFEDVRFSEIRDGTCVQLLHIGSYDEEPQSFKKMEDFINEKGLVREDKRHREIYLSDFRKTEKDKLQTVLRIFVKEGNA
jgi:hypothetical protein